MKRFSYALPLAVALATMMTLPAQSQIQRGCAATIHILPDTSNFTPVTPTTVIARIDARGVCKNKTRANDCRRAAAATAKRCISDLWAARWSHEIPLSCRSKSGGRNGADLQWDGILPNLPHGYDSVKDRMEYYVCCSSNANNGKHSIRIALGITGDKGCGGGRDKKQYHVFENNYGVNCQALRAGGLCGN